jgi:hypothetical protein
MRKGTIHCCCGVVTTISPRLREMEKRRSDGEEPGRTHMKIPTGTVTFPRLGTWSSAWGDMVLAR